MKRGGVAFLVCALALSLRATSALDEFRIKREAVFEFTAKPQVVRRGDATTITFAVRGRCDVTVAIEDAQGRIVRHLASGVLGENAPAPLTPGALRQTIVWDGKNDQDEYVMDKDAYSVRVSLGLKPSFEKNLFWEPRRRHGAQAPIFQVAPEGVYVYDGGNGLDFVKLYDHDGSYIRTIYPFPGDKIDRVRGIPRRRYPQDGETLPVKSTHLQQTFLTCGNLWGYAYPKAYAIEARQADGDAHFGMFGNASSILAVNGGRLALGKTYLFRMATDGSSGGMDAEGPAIALTTMGRAFDTSGQTIAIAPRSAALSPDGKTLYLTCYIFAHFDRASADIVGGGRWDAFHAVLKMDPAGDKPPVLFAGNLEVGVSGTDNKSFHVPSSVAVDAEGRVYVSDFMNNRIQIFAPDGAFLKSVAAHRPAIVSIAAKTQEIYVFSSLVYNRESVQKKEKITPSLTIFGPFANPQKRSSFPLPAGFGVSEIGFWYGGRGNPLSAAVNGYTDPPTVWMANEWARETVLTRGRIDYSNVTIFKVGKDALEPTVSFGHAVTQSVQRARPAPFGRARLYANPKNGKVYVAEGDAFDNKSFKTLIELDPETSRIRIVDLPFDAEDMAFDHNGHVYLRSIGMVLRYQMEGWREIPWDYGEDKKGVHTSASSDRKMTDARGGLALPADGGWHHGGMFVSLRGNLVMACGITLKPPEPVRAGINVVTQPGIAYAPTMFPGRSIEGRGGAPLMHIWDRHGRILFDDVVPGIGGNTYGLGLDRDNNVYLMSSATRVIDGEPYLNRLSGTLMKAIPGKTRIVSRNTPIPLTEALTPERSADLSGTGLSSAWVEGAGWLYGGVGIDGKNAGVGCGCWHARMAFDYFNRTFAPELHRFKIAVLDANGNLILRIGRYGNADSSGPQSKVPLGGDEVGMMHGAYLATHTDRRLFVADPANDRIFSVKLDYHVTERVALKGAPDQRP